MNIETLRRPLSLQEIRDGAIYSLDFGRLPRSGLFLDVGCIDRVFLKMPTRRGLADYLRFVRHARTSQSGIRPLEDDERFERLASALEQFPELGTLAAERPELVHYLAVHKLQFERLRGQTAVGIPAARFALLSTGMPKQKLQPALFQERIEGTTLWEMFDFSSRQVAARWQPALPGISAQLASLLRTNLPRHIDWNIQNFVFREDDRKLFYVDLKPTVFAAAQTNERNLEGIRAHFIG